jgi:hypothetical protein
VITYLILKVLDCIKNISCGVFLNSDCCNLFCNVWVCVRVGFCNYACVCSVVCGCFGNKCTCIYCVAHCLYGVFCMVSFTYFYLPSDNSTAVSMRVIIIIMKSRNAYKIFVRKPERDYLDDPGVVGIIIPK